MTEYQRGPRSPYWIDRNNNIRKSDRDVSGVVMEPSPYGKQEDVDCIKQLLERGAHFDALVHELRRLRDVCDEINFDTINIVLKEVGAD